VSGDSYQVLGPLRVLHEGREVPLGGAKQRTVLAVLLLDAGRVVAADRLIELVWGQDLPLRAGATLQVYVSNLRRALRDAGADRDVLVSRAPGYAAQVGADQLDLLALAELVEQAHGLRRDGDAVTATNLLRLALGLWRGPALADLRDRPTVAPLVASLDRQRAELQVELFETELGLGQHRRLQGELQAAVADQPHDERLVELLVLAHYRSGRQGDALAAYRALAQRLADDLGIDPGPRLRALEAAVLAQDPALDLGQAAVDLAVTRQRHDLGVRGACLVLANGVELELAARTWVIGRDPTCEVVLADPEASRRHAEVRAVRAGYLLVDLGSTNGTRVGSQEIREHRLADGDRIQVGTSELRFRVG
jgi:DNA-binding SARP family transcriptional activator